MRAARIHASLLAFAVVLAVAAPAADASWTVSGQGTAQRSASPSLTRLADGNVKHHAVALLRPSDGSAFGSFNPRSVNSTVRALAPAANAVGSLYIAGSFDEVGGAARRGLAEATPRDVVREFDPRPNGDVNALLLARNGTLFAGGSYTTTDGASQRGLALLRAP